MLILNCEQLSPEWFQAKIGVPSAGSFDKIITTKGEPSKQRTNYMYQLAGELVSGYKNESYTNFAMQRGVELEADARKFFEFTQGVEVKQCGIVYPDENKKYGCSPDGLLDDAGLEIKSPLVHTHVAYLLDGKLPMDYFQQVQGGMLCTGFDHWFFLLYYPGLAPLLIRVERDDKFIEKLKAELDTFCAELATIVNKLRLLER